MSLLKTSSHWLPKAAVLTIAALALAGCHSGSSNSESSSVTLTGAGSTFVTPLMSSWIKTYTGSHQNLQVNYQSIGSGGGIQQVKNGTVDFGASDAALSDDQLKTMPPIIQVPEAAGPVCITYNLPELKQPLKLSGAALAGIYLGTVKNWSDPVITKTNAGVKLPNLPILVAHRSDGSGTTNIFTTYLATVSPEWSSKIGKGISVAWPVGLGGKGSEGVTNIVKQTHGTIGYVELNYATENHLPVVAMQNPAGQFIEPTAAAAQAALAAYNSQLAQDVRNPVVNSNQPGTYPISGLTFLLIPKDGNNVAKRQALKDFVEWMITDGQSASTQLSYAQIPSSLASIDQKLLQQMTANGQPLK